MKTFKTIIIFILFVCAVAYANISGADKSSEICGFTKTSSQDENTEQKTTSESSFDNEFYAELE